MPRLLYVNADPATQTRAATLGCQWFPDVPAEFKSFATTPCVIVAGGGQMAVLPETTTTAAIATAAAPIIAAETTIVQAETLKIANRDSVFAKARTALTANATFLAIASPSAAQVAAQVKLLTRESNGLIRSLLNQFDDVSDT